MGRDSGNDIGHFSFLFLRVGSCISEVVVIILPEMQILKVGSRISNLNRFSFSYLNLFVFPSHVKQLGTVYAAMSGKRKSFPLSLLVGQLLSLLIGNQFTIFTRCFAFI